MVFTRHLPTLTRRFHSLALLAISLVLTTACVQKNGDDPGGSITPQTAEKAYSATPTDYSSVTTATVTATATFTRYNDGSSGLVTSSTLPIRYAEVHVLDGSGNQIQQTETDGSGNISLVIPRTAGSYTLRVNSRADNSNYKASVLNNPYDQVYYSLDTPFTLDGTQSSLAVTITPAPNTNSSNLLGGAFNILDQILEANIFLRTEANKTCPAGCTNTFTVAPKIPIYWAKGISPGTYYGDASTPISFFTNVQIGNVYRGLYILGGINGDVCTDTDHFDRSVIIHEYGHFLEASFGKSASPGGSHNGNKVIDPRLAWSEGWADFFQAAALGRTFYRDTYANVGCGIGNFGLSFSDFQMETQPSSGFQDSPGTNEGIFREIAISRTLYDVMTGASQDASYNMTNNTDGYAADLGFNFIWQSFKSLGSSTYHFQNMGILNQIGSAYVNGISGYSSYITNYSNVLSHEQQATTQSLYGQQLTPQVGATCTFSFASGTPVAEETDQGAVIYSNPLKNNNFFRYDYDGNPSNSTILLHYQASSTPYDLDLYLYNENYVHLDPSTLVAYGVHNYPESGGAGSYPGYESASLNGSGAGTYMINVKVDYAGSKATTTYYLETASGARLCP